MGMAELEIKGELEDLEGEEQWKDTETGLVVFEGGKSLCRSTPRGADGVT